MTWNYRMIRHDDVIGIHEVYYNEAGKVRFWTASPIAPLGEDEAEMDESLQRLRRALSLPVLIEKGDTLVEEGAPERFSEIPAVKKWRAKITSAHAAPALIAAALEAFDGVGPIPTKLADAVAAYRKAMEGDG